ncbi:hypothetical protein CSB85_3505 [Pseudomonas aeruginosa]|nr:hypothetical protein CSB85_3505 [Pseudomonas aeruginosa]
MAAGPAGHELRSRRRGAGRAPPPGARLRSARLIATIGAVAQW